MNTMIGWFTRCCSRKSANPIAIYIINWFRFLTRVYLCHWHHKQWKIKWRTEQLGLNFCCCGRCATMITSPLLWTMLGNLEVIKSFTGKSHSKIKDCRLQKDCNCKKSVPIQPLIDQSYLSLQKVRFGSTVNFSQGIWSFWYRHTLSVFVFFVWELSLECQGTFIFQFYGLYVNN